MHPWPCSMIAAFYNFHIKYQRLHISYMIFTMWHNPLEGFQNIYTKNEFQKIKVNYTKQYTNMQNNPSGALLFSRHKAVRFCVFNKQRE